jgi:hypothetical protein
MYLHLYTCRKLTTYSLKLSQRGYAPEEAIRRESQSIHEGFPRALAMASPGASGARELAIGEHALHALIWRFVSTCSGNFCFQSMWMWSTPACSGGGIRILYTESKNVDPTAIARYRARDSVSEMRQNVPAGSNWSFLSTMILPLTNNILPLTGLDWT